MAAINFLALDDAIEKGASFVLDNPDIVTFVSKVYAYNDEPKLYQYSSYFKEKYNNILQNDSTASGISFDKNSALIRLIGEIIERYSLTSNDKISAYKSYIELEQLKEKALNPLEIVKMMKSKMRLKYSNSEAEKFRWTEARSLTNRTILIPSQLIYVPYLFQNKELNLQSTISTGAAAGTSIEDAIYRGICEIIERDAFMIAYLNKLPSPKINLKALKDVEILKIIEILERYKLECVLLDITTDIGIPAFASILIDKTEMGPAISVGLKAGFDIKKSIIGAIEESLMTRSWIRDELIYKNKNQTRKKIVSTIEDRANFWIPTSSIQYLNFWLENSNCKNIKLEKFKKTENDFLKIKKKLKDKKIDTFYVDITDEKIKKYGFTVAKVIIPKLQPLYLDERYPLHAKRLYKFQQKEIIKKPLNSLNKIPHPFL